MVQFAVLVNTAMNSRLHKQREMSSGESLSVYKGRICFLKFSTSLTSTHLNPEMYEPGPDLQLWGARGNQNVDAPTIILLFVLIPYNKKTYKVTLRDFREADVSIKHVDSISVLGGPGGGGPPWSLHLKSGPGPDANICILSYQSSLFIFYQNKTPRVTRDEEENKK
jgi:hypothetical protein